ncbi:hypothetical protein Cgig2_004595 [Carnegiea gigantea]|uniref:ADP,ATP carrier protein n=1 Tax=Carnegiea gigantea TaxID=171969 RepID=A0A9Q1JMA9_9CARY|nr:hypothetical protein Cgig2_004595 [Carnegiea gigantea]
MGTLESLKFLVSQRYIRDLAIVVVAYGISINLIEVTWNSKLKARLRLNIAMMQFRSPNEYSSFMGDFFIATGIASFTMILVIQFIFQSCYYTSSSFPYWSGFLFIDIIWRTASFSACEVCDDSSSSSNTWELCRTFSVRVRSTISLFDPYKEMMYIPLDEETKVCVVGINNL